MRGLTPALLLLPLVGALGAANASLAGRVQQPALDFPSQTPVTTREGARVELAELIHRPGLDVDLWVVRLHAAWCGTCQLHASGSHGWRNPDHHEVALVDVVVADADNQPASADDAVAWQARIGGSGVAVAGEASPFDALFPAPAPLPRVMVVDTRRWSVLATLASPSRAALDAAVARALEGLEDPGARAARARSADTVTRVDDRFTPEQWALIEGMRLPSIWPSDPTNRVAELPMAATFGAALFEETGLAPSRRSCVSCHMPDMLFTNGKDVAGEGIGPGKRNVPTVVLSGQARWLNADGAADSGWAQALLPFEDADEMGSSRLYVAHGVFNRQRRLYEAVFGPLPPLDDPTRFPQEGRPGTPAWAEMSPADQQAVNTVYANVGKALAAYQRSLVAAPNALDRYADGERTALTAAEKDGLLAFLEAGCAQCHYGPRLTDDAFHNLRFPTGRPDRQADRGRAEGIPHLIASEFRADGAFSDAPRPWRPPVEGPHAVGAFRTPTLRGVPYTMPYGHGGGFGGLVSVVDAHRTGGLPPDSRFAVGEAEPWAQGFDPGLTPRIVTFLHVLRADIVQP